ncbi:MAG: molybdate ABC transporter substrate-binding protein [Spirulina sp. SIO3F2]|nr:molybdate ABC transporter substrate-binding protein [Spirulina sp. SIO3F2]
MFNYYRLLRMIVSILLMSWLTIACHTPSKSSPTLTISAAASLQIVLETIAPQFQHQFPDIAIAFNFGASGALQQQIEQGAPVDVFFSAAIPQMNALAQKGLLLDETRQDIVGNRLVLIAPLNSPLEINDLEQLKELPIGHLAVGEFRSVPAGQYAQQVFEQFGLLTSLQSKFVFGKTVRSTLTAVENGNAQLGIVYATDAAISDRVQVLLTIPDHAHQPIHYPIAVLAASKHPVAAQEWLNFLQGETVQTAFAEFGFIPLKHND